MELLDGMHIPTRDQIAATNAQLGTVELRPGYVIHRTALAECRRARVGYRGPWFRGQRIVIAASQLAPDVRAEME